MTFGVPNGICDRCGFERELPQLRKEWTGLRVCYDTCWEPRHPQDFVRGVPDRQAVRDPRPDPEPYFIPDAIPEGYALMLSPVTGLEMTSPITDEPLIKAI